jgi:prepilin-type N-terminal cleavage/methylation domain-containing protein
MYEYTNQGKKNRRPNSYFCKNSYFVFTKGFSIVETIVAIAILAVAIVAPLSLAQRGLNASIYARDQVTAFYLAQEAIEYVRNVRDNNNLLGRSGSNDWLKDLENCNGQTCGLDVTIAPPTIITCAGAGSDRCLLVFNATTGIYGDFGLRAPGGTLSSGWQATSFTRTLQISPFSIGTDNNAAADLAVTVSWRSGPIQKSLTLNDKIFDWFPAPVE